MISKCLILISFLFSFGYSSFGQNDFVPQPKIQIALLLDVSASMEGLLDQTKAQIWKMLNQLSRLEKNKVNPSIQISIATFGNADSPENGYFKMYGPLLEDIDFLSEKLFELHTEGSTEYCGYAIECAVDSLIWSSKDEDLKVIFIAGNEIFSQGHISYKWACSCAEKEGIIVNTIFCGSESMGKDLFWEDAALRSHGKYHFINSEGGLGKNETFWDSKIFELNERLNKTYIPFGQMGLINQQRQLRQDENTLSLGNNYMRERVVFKTEKGYDNSNWDLVDALREDSLLLQRLQPTDLPVNLQGKSLKELEQYIQRKSYERESFKESIRMYKNTSDEFVRVSTNHDITPRTLENSFIAIITEQAQKKGFEVK